MIELLKLHCSHIECIPSVSVEMLAKSAADPGSSESHYELLDIKGGMTQYSMVYPIDASPISVETLFFKFKSMHKATLIAIEKGEGILLNPPLDELIVGGTKIFYISAVRMRRLDWAIISK